MGGLCVTNALDGYYVLAIDAGEGCQASVDAGMVYLLGGRIILADNDGASTTSALTTTAVATKSKKYLSAFPVGGYPPANGFPVQGLWSQGEVKWRIIQFGTGQSYTAEIL